MAEGATLDVGHIDGISVGASLGEYVVVGKDDAKELGSSVLVGKELGGCEGDRL